MQELNLTGAGLVFTLWHATGMRATSRLLYAQTETEHREVVSICRIQKCF